MSRSPKLFCPYKLFCPSTCKVWQFKSVQNVLLPVKTWPHFSGGGAPMWALRHFACQLLGCNRLCPRPTNSSLIPCPCFLFSKLPLSPHRTRSQSGPLMPSGIMNHNSFLSCKAFSEVLLQSLHCPQTQRRH